MDAERIQRVKRPWSATNAHTNVAMQPTAMMALVAMNRLSVTTFVITSNPSSADTATTTRNARNAKPLLTIESRPVRMMGCFMVRLTGSGQ